MIAEVGPWLRSPAGTQRNRKATTLHHLLSQYINKYIKCTLTNTHTYLAHLISSRLVSFHLAAQHCKLKILRTSLSLAPFIFFLGFHCTNNPSTQNYAKFNFNFIAQSNSISHHRNNNNKQCLDSPRCHEAQRESSPKTKIPSKLFELNSHSELESKF